ncbi:MAG: hypothetical protein ACFFDN_01135 [Candidatus Hodarchaeota archaeon]
MKDWQKTLFIIIGIIIMVILVISGINAITFVNTTSNELGFLSGYLLLEQNMIWAILVAIYSGSRPNRNIFIAGIVITVIGIIGFLIITGKSHSFLSSKLTKRQKTILKPILIIICIISIIIGGVNVFYSQRNRFSVNIFRIMILLLLFLSSSNEDILTMTIVLYEILKPYSSTVIIGFFMIGIGILGLFFQGILYESSKIRVSGVSRYRSYEPITPVLYRRIPKRRIRIKKCPACHAPLRKKPPCECEYCGTVLDY